MVGFALLLKEEGFDTVRRFGTGLVKRFAVGNRTGRAACCNRGRRLFLHPVAHNFRLHSSPSAL
jgi:hypothetical protein